MAQSGIVRGSILDESNGEAIPFATIYVEETGTGTVSDLDGKYNLELPVGTYTLNYRFLGYTDKLISEVVVADGEVSILEVKMGVATQQMDEVVVTAKQERSSEAALAAVKSKSSNMIDGISAQSFKRIGDSNAGEAIKRVTGVSVEGGKHIYVRGLGDRYTKTLVNGMSIPGLDPDRNSFEMDLFPTNLIDNITIFKTFSPNLPGDFTGGIVNIATKDFPEQKTINIGGSLAYNSSMNMNSNFLYYEGGNRDLWGMDDGTRSLPFSPLMEIPNPAVKDPMTTTATTMLDRTMAAQRRTNDFNKSLSLSAGNQFNFDNYSVGYVAALNYKHAYKYYEDAEFNTFIFDEQNFPGEYKLAIDKAIRGDIGKTDVMWSAMAGTSLKLKQHRFALNVLRLQNGTSTAVQQTIEKSQSSSALLYKDVLEYQERSVNNINLTGKHSLKAGRFEIDWSLSPSFIEVDEPDLRSTAFEMTPEGNFQLAPAVGAEATRAWRNLTESSYSGKVDFTQKLDINSQKTKLKFGFSATEKSRNFSVQNYLVRVFNQDDLDINGNPDMLFESENIWVPGSDQGTYIRGQFEPSNSFEAQQRILAAYAMHEFPVSNKLKFIYGLRVESAQNWYTGTSNDGQTVIVDSLVLDEVNLLPSLNAVYELKKKMNLRVSANRTLARPSFKEKSIAQIQDRITGRTFIGNLDLQQTTIDNFDIRWEKFGMGTELFSVSAFYKNFQNPIELLPYSDNAPSNFQARNLEGGAIVYGVELEVVKRLSSISERLRGFTVGTNLSLIQSEATRTTLTGTGEDKRPMFGQSPYILNANVSYRSLNDLLEFSGSYNVQGKKLVLVGAGSLADVYDQPFHSLNFKTSMKVGLNKRSKVSISASNILNSSNQKLYEAFSGDTGIFELLNPGRTISLSYSLSL